MVIFHSYVKLPEGNGTMDAIFSSFDEGWGQKNMWIFPSSNSGTTSFVLVSGVNKSIYLYTVNTYSAREQNLTGMVATLMVAQK